MKRRTMLAGIGGTLSTGLAVGSGAFSSVSAARDVAVSVAEDDNAYLRLKQRGTGRRSYADGPADKIAFDIPSPDEGDYDGTDPEGLGTDSVYRFAEDAASDQSGLFAVENRGTEPIRVFGSQQTSTGTPEVDIFEVETDGILTQLNPSDPLSVGEQLVCGLQIGTEGVRPRDDEYDVTLTINAVAASGQL